MCWHLIQNMFTRCIFLVKTLQSFSVLWVFGSFVCFGVKRCFHFAEQIYNIFQDLVEAYLLGVELSVLSTHWSSVCFLDKLLCFWNIPSIHLLFYTIDCTRLFYKNRTLFIVFQITCTFNFQWRHICLLLFLCNCRIWKCVLYIQQHILLKHIYGCML